MAPATGKAAKKNHISTTAEIAMRLGKSVGEEEMWGAARYMIFAMAATFVSVGQQEAHRRNIEINQWTTDPKCVGHAWIAASQALLKISGLQTEDRLQFIAHLGHLEDPRMVQAKWMPMPDITDPEK